MSGFLAAAGPRAETAIGETNNAGTYYGAADGMWRTIQNVMGAGVGLGPAQNAASTVGLPGSGPLGHAFGAVSALGLADNVDDILTHGANRANVMNGVSNALNVGSWAAGTFGTAGGVASTVAAPLMAAGAGGLSLGMASNDFIASTGWLGEKEDGEPGEGRSWSDMAADWGAWADKEAGGGLVGTLAGFGATAAGSLVGTAGTLLTAPAVIGRGLKRGGEALFASVLDDVMPWDE